MARAFRPGRWRGGRSRPANGVAYAIRLEKPPARARPAYSLAKAWGAIQHYSSLAESCDLMVKRVSFRKTQESGSFHYPRFVLLLSNNRRTAGCGESL